MRRSWKAFYASLRDMVLYLQKNDQQPATVSVGDTNAIRLHHAFAQEATDYRKRQHVFRLKTADWAEYLFQTSDHDLMTKWIDAINLIAASFSSPPLPAAIDSLSIQFQRPLLSSVQTRYSVFEQYEYIINQINQISRQLNELKGQSYTNINNENNLNINGELKQSTISTTKAKDMIEHKDKFEYLEYEVGEINLFKTFYFSIQIFF
jgi:regulator of replication initiation timing